LSDTAIEALRAPAARGENLTEIVQLPPAATLVPHVFVWLKSAAFVPETPMLVMANAALPEFESVSVLAALVVFRFWFPKARLKGVSEACGTATPVPLRAAL